MLRCYRVPLIPVHRIFSENGDVLIVENEATFDSVSRWNLTYRQFRMVIYGRGLEIEKAVDFLRAQARDRQCQFYYFGDVDRTGISTPYRLSRTLRNRGHPGILPAAAAYR